MHERIKQLAEQAGYEKDMFGIGHWDMPECKKFAELIVRECADIAMREDHDPAECILNHFGLGQMASVKVGAEIMAGDGGYSIGTKESYDEFVAKRNYPIPYHVTNTDNPVDFPKSGVDE